ncbi:MAG: OmpA family protein [Spirochaetaceae bacterium]|jgi:outer membrane protein OmpA-like peptidoglycan-associated protein|nr:OmpA family protein [Spirochaetaceae bacterium]
MRRGVSVRAVFFLLLLPFSLWAESFFYAHEQGNKYRIISTVHESVYFDRVFSHRAEILNRISVEVLSASEDGTGAHRAAFQTAERAEGIQGGNIFQWSREYESEFERDKFGYLTIDGRYYMPVVRNVPVFPGRDLSEGDTWSAEGHEMHDFRDSFGIAEPYRIPFTANYTYLGLRERKEHEYPAFSVSYRIFFEPQAAAGRIWPVRILGASDQVVYWDTQLGQAAAYEESFRMIFELSDGRTVEYRGTAEAEIYEAEIMDKESIAGEIAGDISRLGIEDASVRVADEGVVISLEDIQFMPDSAVLMETEKDKIDKIAGILLRYPDRDILVGGHTALAGSAAGRLRLSRERAAAVAEYLLQRGVRSADRIVVRGYGAERPAADNRTPEGMRKNRRVEITLLEN